MEKKDSPAKVKDLLQFWKVQAAQPGGHSSGGQRRRREKLVPKKAPDSEHHEDRPVSKKQQQTETDGLRPEPRSTPTRVPLKTGHQGSDERDAQKRPGLLTDQQPQQPQDLTLQLLWSKLLSYVEKEWLRLQRILKPHDHRSQAREEEEEEEEETMKGSREAFLKITEKILLSMNQEQLVERLWRKKPVETTDVRKSLQRKFRHMDNIAKEGERTQTDDIDTELFVTNWSQDHISEKHEVQQVKAPARKHTGLEKTIQHQDLLTDPSIRCLLTKGVAGIGKTILTQKVTLDWAEDKAHQDFDFIFCFTFRELNVLKGKKFSLVELINHFFPETKKVKPQSFEEVRVLFIFEGLDECDLPLDFNNNPVLTKVVEPASLDVLLTNLLKRNLLRRACLWMTSRPAAANKISCNWVDMVTEVRGFNDHQMEQYFRNRFRDKKLSRSIIAYIKTSRSLDVMGHLPIFCRITATVVEDMLKMTEIVTLPKTLTEMYIYFLVVQTKFYRMKYDKGAETESHWTRKSKKMIKYLGKLAFQQLQKRKFTFRECDLTECGIKLRAASDYSQVFSQVFREERGLSQEKVFSFVHMSVQEFLAALYVHMKFTKYGVNLLHEGQPAAAFGFSLNHEEFYQSALNEGVKDPKLDMFLRFLLGLSLKSNQSLLRGLSEEIGSSWTSQKSAELIQKKIRTTESRERIMNLFHCLDELKDTSLVEEVQQMIRSGRLFTDPPSSSHWSALIFLLLTSQEDPFDLNKYGASMEAFLNLLPVIRASNKVLLRCCSLSMNCCEVLSSVLKSPSSELTELDLSNNDLKDCGVKLLCEGLKSPNCQVETLRLRLCGLSKESCPHLSSVLGCPSSCLKNLDLSDNDLKDAGVNLLCVGLKNPHCHLETLSLLGCLVTEVGCDSLASALRSNPSHLRELDLSWNHPEGRGLDLLSAALQSQNWRLETLMTMNCDKQRLTPGLRKYFCQFTLDPDTAHQRLRLTNNNKTAELMREDQKHPYSPRRFTLQPQLVCENSLAAHHYWEVEHQGDVLIAVTHRQHRRTAELEFGQNDSSWSLRCLDGVSYEICHNNTKWSMTFHSVSDRVGVYVDWSAGVVSFYRVTNDTLIHIHTFYTSFTQPLYPAFGLRHQMGCGSSVTLSGLDEYSLL